MKSIFDQAFLDGITPDPLLSVSEWSDRHRVLSQRASAEPGMWRTDRTPYLKEIMDTLSVEDPTREIVFMKSAQIGGTEAGNNWLGYIVDHSPGPLMVVQPTVELAKRNSKQRIDPLIAESPRLRSKVKDKRARDSGNTVLQKEFPGGVMVLTGANSAVGLRSLPARFLFLDEVDGYPFDVDNEGEPTALAKKRTNTFARRKIFMVSTPTIEGQSRITAAYEDSDKRRFHVPCVLCGHMQPLVFKQLKWEQGEYHHVEYECVSCGKRMGEGAKREFLPKGEWVAEHPERPVAGFHINALYSPLGWLSWPEIAKEWDQAKGNNHALRTFINTICGEAWRERGDAPSDEVLYLRREQYKMGTCPEPVVFLTAGVDVQKDRLEMEIVGWCQDGQSYSIDYRVLTGETTTQVPWEKLDVVLAELFPHAKGGELPIKMLAVDTGYNTQTVYAWCRRHTGNVIGVKGVPGAGMILGQPTIVDVNDRGKKIRRGFKVWPVGVNMVKTETYNRLKLPTPEENEPHPPGFCHFPEYGREFFKQLTAEQLMKKVVKGFPKYEWEKVRERNEALDCRVYARAAASACGMDRWNESTWSRMRNEIADSETKKPSVGVDKPRVKVKRKKATWL